jgi:hypothetical protein
MKKTNCPDHYSEIYNPKTKSNLKESSKTLDSSNQKSLPGKITTDSSQPLLGNHMSDELKPSIAVTYEEMLYLKSTLTSRG